MKKTFFKSVLFASVISATTFLAACDDEKGIEIGIPQTVTQVFAVDQIGTTSIDTLQSVGANLDSVLATKNASRDDVNGIILSQVQLSICDSAGNDISGANFSLLQSMAVEVGKGSDPLVVVASADSAQMAGLAGNPITLPLATTNFDFLPYAAESTFKVRLHGALKAPVTTKFYIKSKVTFTVKATI